MFIKTTFLVLATQLLSTHVLQARAACPCGYQDSNGAVWREAIEADFTTSYTTALSNFAVQTWGSQRGSYYMQNTAANVYSYNDGLGVKTSGYDDSGTIKVGEIDTTRSDILYGSFRIYATVPSVPGVCFGFFTYESDTQEADIEILTSDTEYYRTVHYTNQPGLVDGDTDPDAAKTIVIPGTDIDFTAFGWHRLDWTPSQTAFYYNNQLETTITKNVPTSASTLIFNVWSDGGTGWTQGPPTADAISTVYYINAYFNSTSLDDSTWKATCAAAGNVAPCAV